MFVLSLLRRLFDALSTFLLVTAAAACIWLFVERKTVYDQTGVEIEVDYGTPSQQQDLFIVPADAPRKVIVSFKASDKVAGDIRAELKKLSPAAPFHIPLDIRGDQDSQRIKVSLREQLEKHFFSKFAASNVQVEQNPQVDVLVEKLRTIELPLKTFVVEPISKQAEVAWDAPPPAVAVRLPAASLANDWEKLKPAASVRLDKADPGMKIGDKATRQVPVEIDALDFYYGRHPEQKQEILKHLLITPASVGATFTLTQTASADLTLGRLVPVTVDAPPSILNDWSFSLPLDDEKFLKDLKLTCTDETKKRIQSNEQGIAKAAADNKAPEDPPLVWAVARVTSTPTPAPNGTITLPLEVITPTGASVSPAFSLPKTVTVKATRRNP